MAQQILHDCTAVRHKSLNKSVSTHGNGLKRFADIKSAQIDSGTRFNIIIHNIFHGIARMRATTIFLETKLIVTGY